MPHRLPAHVMKISAFSFGLIARFGAAGILSTLVHLIVVWAASRGLHWPLDAANALAYAVANVASWFMQSRWTFRDQPRSGKRWILASVGLLVVSWLGGHVVDAVLPGASYGWLLAVTPIIGLSLFIMRFWVFAPRAT